MAARFPTTHFLQAQELRGKIDEVPSPKVAMAAAVAMRAKEDGAIVRAAPGYMVEDAPLWRSSKRATSWLPKL